MTEEEKKRREAVKFTPVVEEEEQRRAEKANREAWRKSIEAQRQEAARLKEYASSPVKADTSGQASLSAAYHTSAKEAAERRRQNAKQYELARQKAIEAQRKQDKDNADRYKVEVKARADAGKRAAGIEQSIAKQLQTQGNAARNYKLAKDRAAAAQGNADRNYGLAKRRVDLAQERNDISRSKGGRKGGGSGNTQADYDEYARWERLYPQEVEEIRTDNAQINPYTGQREKSVTSTLVKLVNAKMRQKYGAAASQKGGGNGSALHKRSDG